MKLTTTLIVLVLAGYGAYSFVSSTGGNGATASGFRWMEVEQAVTAARENKKSILIDVYTDWCSWCKKMDKEVYTHESVVKILNKEFVAIKLNAESNSTVTFSGRTMSQMEFARALGINSYPTTVFFTSDAQLITTLPGFVPGEEFSKILSFIGEEHYEKMTYEEFRKNPGTRN